MARVRQGKLDLAMSVSGVHHSSIDVMAQARTNRESPPPCPEFGYQYTGRIIECIDHSLAASRAAAAATHVLACLRIILRKKYCCRVGGVLRPGEREREREREREPRHAIMLMFTETLS